MQKLFPPKYCYVTIQSQVLKITMNLSSLASEMHVGIVFRLPLFSSRAFLSSVYQQEVYGYNTMSQKAHCRHKSRGIF